MNTPYEPDPPAQRWVPALASAACESARPWYVMMSKPRQEQHAASKLREQGYDVCLLMLEQWVRRAGALSKKQAVMFPRYGFVRPAMPQQAVGPIRSTPGVTCLVRFGPVLACLSAERVLALQVLVAERAACPPEQPFPTGQQVVFSAGPLKGLGGIVSSSAAERVLVMISMLGREQTVAVQVGELAVA